MESSKTKSSLTVMDELLFISILIICGGVVFMDAYYKRFGVNYQFLDSSTTKVIFQGLKLSFSNHLVLLLYVIPILLLFSTKVFSDWKYNYVIQFVFYVLVVSSFFMVYRVAEKAGIKAAYMDMLEDETELPSIVILKTVEAEYKEPGEKWLLFMSDESFITIFSPLEKGETQASPILKRIPKDHIIILETINDKNHN